MTDPYADIEMPTPPRGHRYAEWNEAAKDSMWWSPTLSEWVRFGSLDPQWYGEPEWSIFAIPKPRVRLETPQ